MKNSKITCLALWAVSTIGLILAGSTKSYATPATDYEALRTLYLSTDGDNWYNNTGWPDAATFVTNPTMPAGTDLDTWYRVTVDGSGCVTRLTLTNNQLSGSVPPELGNLSNLELLWLDDNQLSGSIPAELGNLSNLEWLDLGNNQLSGIIPPELGNLSNLGTLWLFNNQLIGNIPTEIANLSSLWNLSLSSNQLSGIIPAELGNLNGLSILSLGNNQLSGSIPPELGNVNSLSTLRLRDNQLTGSIPAELGNLNSLQELNLENNQLSGSIPPELGNIDLLRYFFLSNNQLSGCYHSNLMNLCIYSYYYYIPHEHNVSDGNNFDETWDDFCDTGAGTCNSLPIELSEPLQASIKNKTTILTWTTATETNNKGFEIQKSDEGVNWENIGWQPGQGNSLTSYPYTYTDTKPRLGINYYRFKQIDFDGNFSYSNLVSVHHKVDGVTVYPVPAEDFVIFEVANIVAAGEIILYDITGREINRRAFPQDKQLVISDLNNGVYIYRIFYENEMYSGKIVVE